MQASQAITRKSASNLALAFILLPKPRRDAMVTLYAFCRAVDDVTDEDTVAPAQRQQDLAAWRADIKRACENGAPEFAVNRELQPVIQQFGLPFELFDELIKGCEMDLATTRYETAAQLELYCYRVASVVGLLSIEIFGYQNPKCRDYAIALGQALQLTNILRDVKNDADRNRIYLPQEDLRRFAVPESEILRGEYSDRFTQLARAISLRAREYYRQAHTLLPAEDRRAMVAAELMGSVYWRLLRKIERRNFHVFAPAPIRLGRIHKLALIARAGLRHLAHRSASDYASA